MNIIKKILIVTILLNFFGNFSFCQRDLQKSPEELGFSSDKLKQMENVIQELVDNKKLSGVVTLITRGGNIVNFKTFGYQNVENKIRIRKNSIFRMASIAKIVTGVAALICYEDGLFLLDDPVKKYLPEFKNISVLSHEQSIKSTDSLRTEPLKRDITIRDLLINTVVNELKFPPLYQRGGLGRGFLPPTTNHPSSTFLNSNSLSSLFP